jgi:P2 family phage contractile tail tube protein
MANPVWTLEDANMFCGVGPTDNTASNHLVLTEVKLPGLDMQYVDHRAGGAPIAIEVSTVIARLECTFVCVGLQDQIIKLIGSWNNTMNWFWIYGVIRDQGNGTAAQAAAAIKGQLGRADPQNYRRGDLMHTNYAIRGITHYEFNIAGANVVLWDYMSNTRIIGDVDQNRVINTFLNTAAVTAAPAISTVFPFQPGE